MRRTKFECPNPKCSKKGNFAIVYGYETRVYYENYKIANTDRNFPLERLIECKDCGEMNGLGNAENKSWRRKE